jgi:hypothetical protein
VAALEAFEGSFGLATKTPLSPHLPPGRVFLGPLAAGLLAWLIEGPVMLSVVPAWVPDRVGAGRESGSDRNRPSSTMNQLPSSRPGMAG